MPFVTRFLVVALILFLLVFVLATAFYSLLTESAIDLESDKKEHRVLKEGCAGFYFKFDSDFSNGSFYYVKRIGGKQRWLKLGRRSAYTVKQARNECKVAAAHYSGEGTPRKGGTKFNLVGDIIDYYLSSLKVTTSEKSGTYKSACTLARKHLKPLVGNELISEFDAIRMNERLFKPLIAAGYSLAYIDLMIRLLKKSFSFVRSQKGISDNLLSGVSLGTFTTSRIKMKPLSIETAELKEVVKSIRSYRCYKVKMMAALMLMYGFRIGETCSLDWSMVNFDEMLLNIKEQNTKSSRRLSLPLSNESAQLLRRYKATKRKYNSRGRWLFPKSRNPKQSMNVTHASRLVSEDMKFTAHELRKLMRTWMADSGVDSEVAETMLNHKLSVLSRTYNSSLFKKPLKDAIEQWHKRLIDCGLLTIFE